MGLSFDSVKITADAIGATAYIHCFFGVAQGSDTVDVTPQMYIEQTQGSDGKPASNWQAINPKAPDGSPLKFQLAPGKLTEVFKADLPLGVYGRVRLILFAGGTVGGAALYDNQSTDMPNLNLAVTTTQGQVLVPDLAITNISLNPGKPLVTFSYEIKFPENFTGEAFAIMAKDPFTGSFAQTGNIPASNAQVIGTPGEILTFKSIKGTIDVDLKSPGLQCVQFGLFGKDFVGDPLRWLWPGTRFETSADWVQKCPTANLPSMPIFGASSIVIGGNRGNNAIFVPYPVTPGTDVEELSALKKQTGNTLLRWNYDPDAVLTSDMELRCLEQAVHFTLMAGMIPIVSPQGIPSGADMPQRLANLMALTTRVASQFRGLPVMIGLCNEPHELTTWDDCRAAMRPIAQMMNRDFPDTVIICPTEGYSKSAAAASADPITEAKIGFYGVHPYGSTPDTIAAACGTLPNIMIEEYDAHTCGFEWLQAVTKIPGVRAVMAWAWTVKGSDQLALIQSYDAGAKALVFDDAGKAAVKMYAQLAAGKPLTDPNAPPPPPVTAAACARGRCR